MCSAGASSTSSGNRWLSRVHTIAIGRDPAAAAAAFGPSVAAAEPERLTHRLPRLRNEWAEIER
jgi:hypothetical protein